MGYPAWLSNADNQIRRGATITAYSEQSAYPASNLSSLPLSKTWRSDAIIAGGEWILIDFGSAVTIDLVALINHNLSSEATITVTAGADSSCGSYTADPAIAYREHDAFSILAAAQSYRFWKITITDPGNTFGYVEIGMLLFGDSTLSGQKFQDGWQESDHFFNIENFGDDLTPHVDAILDRKRFSFVFAGLSEVQSDALGTLWASTRRNRHPLFLVPDVDVNDGFFGRLQTDSVRVATSYESHDRAVEFLEDPRGLSTAEDQPFDYVPGDDLNELAAVFTRTSTANQIAEDLKTAAVLAATARDGHYPQLGVQTLLIEDARTNTVTGPEDLTNGAWSKQNCTIGANAATGSDDAVTLDKIIEASDTAQVHYIEQAPGALTANLDQSISFEAKAGERTQVVIGTKNKAGDWSYSFFDLSTHTVYSQGALHSAWARELKNDTTLCEVIWNASTGGETPDVVIILAIAGNASYNGDGASGAYVGHVQYEVDKPCCSSYYAGARTIETLYVPFTTTPRQLTGYIRFTERRSINIASAVIMYIGNAAQSGMRILIDSTGTYYRLRVYNSSTSVTSTLAAAPVIGDEVELRWTVEADGKAQLSQSINGATETNATKSGTLTLESAFSAERVYLGGIGAGYTGFCAIERALVLHGIQNMSTCRQRPSD